MGVYWRMSKQASHMTNADRFCDALIIGAGPVGLMTACQLAMRNISFVIVDKNERAAAYSGALFIHAGSLEAFDQMGIAERAIEEGSVIDRAVGYFNGRRIMDVDIAKMGRGLTRYPFVLALEQGKTERALTGFLAERGHKVERKTGLIGFEQDEDGVTSVLRSIDGREERIRTAYLVGADGPDSFVRETLRIPFNGKTHPQRLSIFDGNAQTALPGNTIAFSFTGESAAGFFPLKDGRWRVDHLLPSMTPDTIAFGDVTDGFANRVGMKAELISADWFSVFRSHTRIAQTFQKGRCFLAGDAAHVFTPVGAQGMNSGFRDAVCLAEILAGLTGHPDAEARDYTRERKAACEKAARAADLAFMFATRRFYRKSRALMGAIALAHVLLKTEWLGRRAFRSIAAPGWTKLQKDQS